MDVRMKVILFNSKIILNYRKYTWLNLFTYKSNSEDANGGLFQKAIATQCIKDIYLREYYNDKKSIEKNNLLYAFSPYYLDFKLNLETSFAKLSMHTTITKLLNRYKTRALN